MSFFKPQQPPRGEVDSRATDQPPGYSAPFTRRQIISLVIPAVIFIVVAAVLIYGLTSSAAKGVASTPTTLAVAASPTTSAAATTAPTEIAAAVIDTATAPPSPTTAPSPTSVNTVAPTASATSAATTTPEATVTSAAPTATLDPNQPTATEVIIDPSINASGVLTQGLEAGINRSLAGKRIALDPGHGPRNDLGAIYLDPDSGKLVLSEDVVNLDVAMRVRELLEARGAVVSMTRETKDTFSMPWPPDTNGDGIDKGQADDLQERIDIINASKADVFLSIHMNSHADPNKRAGIQAVYCATADCPFAAENKRLSIDMLDQLEEKLGAIGYPVKERELRNDDWSDVPGEPGGHLFVIGPAEPPKHPRAVQMPGTIMEALYITSPIEVQELKLDNVRQAIAQAYTDALTVYLNSSK